MIHQFIFAAPKPGLSPRAFQNYWIEFHARDFASKIPQIRQYLIGTRLRGELPFDAPAFEGVAEIWLNNDQEQLESLMSDEFIKGARADEPRWAAFWQTFVHDSEPIVCKQSKNAEYNVDADSYKKVYVFLKRREGDSIDTFRNKLLKEHQSLVTEVEEVKRYLIAFCRDSAYSFGEPRFDALEVWSVSDLSALCKSTRFADLKDSWDKRFNKTHLYTMAAEDNWIIKPGERTFRDAKELTSAGKR